MGDLGWMPGQRVGVLAALALAGYEAITKRVRQFTGCCAMSFDILGRRITLRALWCSTGHRIGSS